MPDFCFGKLGAFYIFVPMTSAARGWIDKNVDRKGVEWLGGSFVVLGPSILTVIRVIEEAGLVVAVDDF